MAEQGLRPDWATLSRVAILATVLTFALTGCGAFRDASAPRDPVAAVAWQEWRRFGGETLVYGGPGTHNGGVHESREPLNSRIGDYWALVGRREWDGRSGKPWSGIFVAWAVHQAGVSAREFPASGRHAGFLMPLLDGQLNGGPRRFVVHDWRDYAPKPGDLICAGTRAAPHRGVEALRDAVDREVTHCDVVVEVRGGQVRAIGGNVRDTVTMSIFPRNGGGTLAEVAGRPWFAVVEKRG
ncbi:MAG TPA: DUF2272 domain-containing protein [Vineibacter sp.]|nr:DUF2272 domain-containing protein [Vineibacter sp.]